MRWALVLALAWEVARAWRRDGGVSRRTLVGLGVSDDAPWVPTAREWRRLEWVRWLRLTGRVTDVCAGAPAVLPDQVVSALDRRKGEEGGHGDFVA